MTANKYFYAKERNTMENQILKFEDNDVDILIEGGEPLFEIYTTGMALGQVKEAKGKMYPHKQRIDNNLKNAGIEPVVRNVQLYMII